MKGFSPTEPGDFDPVLQELSFDSLVTSHRVTVHVREDTVVEETEIFFANLSASPGEFGARIDSNDSVIEIIDDDCKLVWIYLV